MVKKEIHIGLVTIDTKGKVYIEKENSIRIRGEDVDEFQDIVVRLWSGVYGNII